ncbi:MAG: EAL domain-containing protein [Chloracidobacterium sp.]|nr:EAL domain-containing protein [Chloracidobacterium sp.]
MDAVERNKNIFIAAIAPLALGTVVFALIGLGTKEFDPGIGIIGIFTVFCSYFLRIQLPRARMSLTVSDALVILAMVLYGVEVAVILSILDMVAVRLHLWRANGKVNPKGAIVSLSVAPIAVFAAFYAVQLLFGSSEAVLARNDLTSFIWLFVTITAVLFMVSSFLTAAFYSIGHDHGLWRVWSESCFDGALVYLVGGAMAGVIVKALGRIDIYLLATLVSILGLVFLIFRRVIRNMNRALATATDAEHKRAELAEQHVRELKHYVEELERSSEALQESHANFRHAAYHDALTGLPNRNYFLDQLKTLLRQSREANDCNFSVLLLDLNRFKTINDSLGHSIGDRLIRNVGKRLAGMVREQDMVGRFSGDKFGIILTGLGSRDEATAFAERLAKRVAEPYTLDGRQVFTSLKMGIAFGSPKYAEAEDILRDADIAMYNAKDQSEPHVIFDQKMHIRAVTRLQLETDLRFAIERREFELHYQPIIALDNASLVGFEALVRWNHPQRGLVPPNEFIPIAESTGLVIPMTLQILNMACNQIVQWQKQRPAETPLSVAVNLSGKHFAHPDLVDQIRSVINESGIEPSSLKLELTESAVMENAETAILMLKEIKSTGVQISIDDFGTGYSSLSYLHKFPIDLLKVDRSFVSAMESNTDNGEIVRTVIALAKVLNFKVVAEGIESIHQFHQLRILGCEYGQGYLFSKPLKVSDVNKLLSETNRWQNILPGAAGAIRQNPNISHLRLAQ